MRKFYAIMLPAFLFSFLLTGVTVAQNNPKTRLDIKPKAKPAASFSQLQKGAYLRNSPVMPADLRLNRSTAIKDFYRNYFSTLVGTKKVNKPTPLAEPTSVSINAEARMGVSEEISNVEKFYASDKIVVSKIYPNPIDDFAMIDYEIKSNVNEAKFVFVNMLGTQVKEEVLGKNDKKQQIDFRNLPNGMYFYQLSIDGRVPPVSHKLIIRHQ